MRGAAPRDAWRNVRTILCVKAFLLVTLCNPAAAEVSYPPILPATELQFPRDEGSHPAYRIEWWYVTGWLQDGENAKSPPRGFQVTFFRVRTGIGEDNPSAFAPAKVIFAHAAVADPAHGKLRHAQRAARAGFELAYAREGRVDVQLEDWSLREISRGRYSAKVAGDDFAFHLQFDVTQPVMLQGDRGFSRKGPDPRAASHYYSQPHLAVTGTATVEGRQQRVSGEAWLDHEWSSDYVDPNAVGWDWIGINLANGGALMAFRMRGASSQVRASSQSGAPSQQEPRWASATLRTADGQLASFEPNEVEWVALQSWKSPRTGVTYPVKWRVRVGEQDYLVEPLMHDAELDSRQSTGTIYWEGPVKLRSATDGSELGKGYLELTGYGGKLEL